MRVATSMIYSAMVSIILASSRDNVDNFPLAILMGDSEEGGRYYVTLIPSYTHPVSKHGQYFASDDGHKCGPVTFFSRASNDRSPRLGVSVVDAEKGFLYFAAIIDSIKDTCVAELTRYGTITKAPKYDMPPSLGTFSLENPIVKTLNEMCKKGKLLYKVTGDQLPAANALYYGFIEDELEVEVATNATGFIKSVNATDSTGAEYDSLRFTMFGKAMQVILKNSQQHRTVVLEPVDKSKFTGKATFAKARLNTLDGTPFKKDLLPTLLSLKEPENKPSRITSIKRGLKKLLPLSRPHRHGDDSGLGDGLLEQDDETSARGEMVGKDDGKQSDDKPSRMSSLRKSIQKLRRSSKSRRHNQDILEEGLLKEDE